MNLSKVERRILNKALLSTKRFTVDYVGEHGFVPLVHPTKDGTPPVDDDTAIDVAKKCEINLSSILPNKFRPEFTANASDTFNKAEAADAAFSGSGNMRAALEAAMGELNKLKAETAMLLDRVDPEKVGEIARKEAALWVNEKGGVTNRIEIVHGDAVEVIEGELYHKQFSKLLKYSQMRDRDGNLPNIMLFGGAGNGKTRAAMQLAAALDLPYYQHNAVTYEHQLSGYINQMNDTFFETDLIRAYRDGGVVLLDENDRSENDAILPINGALADGFWTLPNGERIKRHKDCLIIVTANTKGQGADRKYVGANKLDAAYLSRFAVKIEWERDEALEAALIGDPAVSERVAKLRNDITYHGVDYDIDTRQAKALSDAVRCGIDMDEALDDIVFSMLTKDQRMILKGEI